MGVPKQLIRDIRRLDEYELRRLLILVRGLLVHVDGHPDSEPDLPPTLTYRQEQVRCGKPGCSTCPHGPYWYAYWKQDGRTRKRYIGRHLPGEPLEPVVPDHPRSQPPDGRGSPDGGGDRRKGPPPASPPRSRPGR